MKVLFLTPYPHDTAGSQRFRFEQYLSSLTKNNIHYDNVPFWEQKAWDILYKPGKQFLKSYYLLKGIIIRIFLIFKLKNYDYLFIHRELFPVGPKVLIKIYAKINPKIIYDFDDAIWLPNFAASNKSFAFLKSYGQVKLLCTVAYKLSVGNQYLANYCKQYNNNIVINPTTIDTSNHHQGTINYDFKKLVVGWTGTHSTMKYLPDILPVLDKLIKKHDFIMRVISDKHPDFEREYLSYIPWNKETEIEDLKTIHIGLMPLHDDEWSRGKCGFKALQYMSIGMPAIVSPVGVNVEIVDQNVNGFICSDLSEWENALTLFLDNQQKIKDFGLEAKQKIENYYSVNSNTKNFISLFS